MENLVIIFSEFGLKRKFLLFAVFMYKSHIWERFGSWYMGQNALRQSDYRIFKPTMSLEQNDEKAWFFACWYRFMEIGNWLKNIGSGHGQKWVWLLGS